MDATSVDKYLSTMMDADLIAVDTETTGIDKIKDGRDHLIGISVAYRIGDHGIFSAYFPFGHETSTLDEAGQNLSPKVRDRLCSVLATKPLVWHHRKFDSHSLASVGINPDSVMKKRQFDVMMEAQLINEESYSKELDALSRTNLNDGKTGDAVNQWANAFGWSTVPINLMAPYARKDAELTLRNHEHQWPELEKQQLDHLWDIESQFTDVLRKMESEGIGVDIDFGERNLHRGRARMDAISSELGFKPTPNNLRNFFFTELGFPVLESSAKTGKASVNKRVMEEYDELLAVSNNPTAQLVLEYRGWQTACGLLYEPTLRLISPDGKIRTNYKQHGPVTSRLSSSGPNMQQVPRKSNKDWNGSAKKLFTPGCDCCELWGFDYSQLEFRLATAYGADQWLVDTFNDPDADVFSAMSERINTPRQTCKTFTYANIYGAGLSKIAYTLRRKEYEIEDLYQNFIESIPGIREASKRANYLARNRRYVRYWTGRRRHFVWDDDFHKAFNSILQGGAAEIVKRSMLSCQEVEDYSEHGDCRMLLQIHDEIVFRIRKGMIDKYAPEIIKRMTNYPELGVKFAVAKRIWNA